MRRPGTPTLGPLPPLAETWRRSFVEFVGVFALVFVGVGTIMAVGPQAEAGTLEVALAHGLGLMHQDRRRNQHQPDAQTDQRPVLDAAQVGPMQDPGDADRQQDAGDGGQNERPGRRHQLLGLLADPGRPGVLKQD